MSIRFLRYTGIAALILGGAVLFLSYSGWAASLAGIPFMQAAVLILIGGLYLEIADLKAIYLLQRAYQARAEEDRDAG